MKNYLETTVPHEHDVKRGLPLHKITKYAPYSLRKESLWTEWYSKFDVYVARFGTRFLFANANLLLKISVFIFFDRTYLQKPHCNQSTIK